MNGRRLWTLALGLSACVPTFDGLVSRIDTPVVLAVEATPAEAAPGQTVTLRALFASPTPQDAPTLSFFACTQPRPLDETFVVAASCATGAPGALTPLGQAAPERPLTFVVPQDACVTFGPVPAPNAQTPLRPTTPDATGGYHLPVFVSPPTGFAAWARVRLRCPLPPAPVAAVRDFAARYTHNQNPEAGPLQVDRPARAGQPLAISLALPAAEPFVRYDAALTRVVDAEESLRVSWYATRGSLTPAETTAGSAPTDVTTTFVAEEPGPVRLWAVVRDSRGGVTWAAADLVVDP